MKETTIKSPDVAHLKHIASQYDIKVSLSLTSDGTRLIHIQDFEFKTYEKARLFLTEAIAQVVVSDEVVS